MPLFLALVSENDINSHVSEALRFNNEQVATLAQSKSTIPLKLGVELGMDEVGDASNAADTGVASCPAWPWDLGMSLRRHWRGACMGVIVRATPP